MGCAAHLARLDWSTGAGLEHADPIVDSELNRLTCPLRAGLRICSDRVANL
jgi:hypothetical protein